MTDTTDNQTGHTRREFELIQKVKSILPAPFIKDFSPAEIDNQILLFIQSAIVDINIIPPQSGMTIETFPASMDPLLIQGCNYYVLLFKQMKWSMNDFSYNNNGFSLTLDRVDKLDKPMQRFLDHFMLQVAQWKTNMMLSNIVAQGSPRQTSILGNFIRAFFGFSN